MRIKSIIFSIFCLIFPGTVSTANAIENVAGASLSNYWSVVRINSVYDTLRVDLKKDSSSLDVKALNDYLNALQFREQLKASDNPPSVFPTSAGIYNHSLNADSLGAYDQLISLYRNLGDRRAEAGVLSSYGVRHAVKGDMDQALKAFQEALQLNKELNDRQAIVRNYFSLARVYKYKGNFEEAVKYNEYIVEMSLLSRNNSNLAEAYMNLANLWSEEKKYKEAEQLIMKKALPLYYYKMQDKIGTMKCYDQLAEIYDHQKRYSEAKWFNIQSNMVARKINNPAGIVNSLINLAHVKMTIGDYQLALRDFGEAEQLSVSNKYSHRLVEIKNDLAKVYAVLGNKSASNSALLEFTALKNALLSTAF